MEKINRFYYRHLKKYSLEDVSTFKYIYIPLHKQPEASIDVIGRYYEDQKTNILNIWRVLPRNWKIVIKEHPTALGDRGISFFYDLLQYQDIRLVDEKVNSYSLILHSECVVTVSGTAAYEAGLIGKCAITLAPAFFNGLAGVNHITLEEFKSCRNFSELLERKEMGMEKRDFSKKLMMQSYSGTISDPALDTYAMSEGNLENLKNAFLNILKETNV
jgi:hypothetical protein